jgi:parallel beta-helix repeat protein
VKFLPAAAFLLALTWGGHTEVSAQTGTQWYVASNGSASGSGAIGSPITLDKALSSSSPAKAGDTIWLRGGTYSSAYTSYLTGTASAPIIVRAYPGERVVLDANNAAAKSSGVVLTVQGGNTYFWGFEITSSDPARPDSGGPNQPNGVYLATSQNVKFINLVIHDLPGQGMGLWAENTDAEVYGCVIYYNGTNHWDHGIYLQNKTGTKTISDNIIFNQASHGIHAYGSDIAFLDNITLTGNTVFESGGLLGGAERNILLGGLSIAHNPIVTNNYTYFRGSEGNSNVGYSAGTVNAQIKGNYFIAGNAAERFNIDSAAVVTGNTFIGSTDPDTLPSKYPSNTYLASRPTTGTTVFVRANKYETGRANVTVYNWAKASTVSVDLSSSGLASGDTFEIRDVQNYFGNPVASGTYTGAAVSVPMTGLPVAAPKGSGLVYPTHTAPQFNAFVVLKKSSSGGTTTPPPTGDTTAPTVSVTSPTSGQTVSGTVTLAATATDNVGVVGVRFQVDYTDVGSEDTAAPYSVSWNSASLANGTHNVRAVGRDAAGNQTVTSILSFNVSNAPSTPTNVHIVAEAESGLLRGAMTAKSLSTASGGVYVSTNTANSGTVYYTVTVPVAGTYVIWGRVLAPLDTADSFFVSMDGGAQDIYDVAEGKWSSKWQWTVVNGRGGGAPNAISQRRFTLTAGTHTIRFDGRELDTRLDKIELTNDLTYVPQ